MVTTKTWKTKRMSFTVCETSWPHLHRQSPLTQLTDAEQGYTIHDLNEEAEDEDDEEEEDDDDDEDEGAAGAAGGGGQGTARVITIQGLGRLLGAPLLHFHPVTETLNAPHHVHPDSGLHPTILSINHPIV